MTATTPPIATSETPTPPEATPADAVMTATPSPTPTSAEPVAAADDLRNAVAGKSEAAGDVLTTLDETSLQLGHYDISLLDVLLVFVVIGGIITFAWLAARIARILLKRITRFDPSQRLLADKLITMGIWAIAVLVGIDLLGIDLTALAVFSGAFGLAIGFGLQKTFGNLIAGIILLMDRSIKPGDVIAVSDQAGNSTFGEIRKIGIRAVSITTRDQKEYLIPNENLMVNQVENWSYSSRNVRMQVPVGVSYNCDIKLAETLMLEAADKCARVLKTPPPTVWLDQYGASSVDFVIQCWITDPEGGIGNIKSEILKTLWDLFQENKIEIPFPQHDIHLRSSEQMEQLIAAISQRVEAKK